MSTTVTEPEITDEMVEAAYNLLCGSVLPSVDEVRAALEAALRVPVGSATLQAPAWEYMERGRKGDYIAYRRRAGSGDPWVRVPVGEGEQNQ